MVTYFISCAGEFQPIFSVCTGSAGLLGCQSVNLVGWKLDQAFVTRNDNGARDVRGLDHFEARASAGDINLV